MVLRKIVVSLFAFLSSGAFAGPTEDFLQAFYQQVSGDGLLLHVTQDEACNVMVKDNTSTSSAMDLKVRQPHSSIGGIHFGATAMPSKRLEKVNQWNWGTTDNLGSDLYRYIGIVAPALGGNFVSEIFVSVKQGTHEVQSFKYTQYRFKSSHLTTLDIPFTDLISIETQVHCYR